MVEPVVAVEHVIQPILARLGQRAERGFAAPVVEEQQQARPESGRPPMRLLEHVAPPWLACGKFAPMRALVRRVLATVCVQASSTRVGSIAQRPSPIAIRRTSLPQPVHWNWNVSAIRNDKTRGSLA
ncbi:hypothetical protein [Cohnella nanjingensis]|uniref:Uncharacterized protein n=1 Tax=Cohnella nanjingensis TaxID=1387779 RepID=A0A7X0RXW9_9BACL|nr:hypothetical protein [Cohnella nanjingensis]MBB6675674.1 hypothetical protein [Cohnella nanjingensis]